MGARGCIAGWGLRVGLLCAGLSIAQVAGAELPRAPIVVTPGAAQVYRVAVQRFAQGTTAAQLAPAVPEPGGAPV